jgi:hypothetical protein
MVLVLAGAAAALAVRGEARERRGALIALAAGAFGLVVVCAGALIDADYVLGRNVLFAWIPLTAAAAIALGSSAAGRAGVAAASLLFALGVWLVLEMKRSDELQRVDYRAAAELIGPPPQGAYRLVVVPGLFLSKSLPRYLDGIAPPSYFRRPPPIELVQLGYAGSDRGPHGLCWWGGACGLFREPVFDPPPGYRLVERRRSDLWTLTRFRALQPHDPGPQGGGDAVTVLQGG